MLVQQLTQAGLAGRSQDAVAKPDSTNTSLPVSNISSSTHQPLTTSKADFVRTMWPHAEQAARELGIDPHALVAQAALETGWGRSVPSDAAGGSSFNLFGIKAGANWAGATVNVPTIEFEEGVAVRRVERFRSYSSPADSFRDYAALIGNNPRYENAVGSGGDVANFATALQQGGYATDPEYARKVVAVADQVRELKSVSGQPLHGWGERRQS
jgi:flagellar protein FlgJ